MRAENMSRLMVTDKGTPVGVISISDLVASIASWRHSRDTVADVMSDSMLVCRDTTPFAAWPAP